MKLLRVKAKGFKNCVDDFEIDFVARSKRTSEDKEYELLEIDEDLYVYNTIGIIGKNASGKSTTLELLDWCYDILGNFRLSGKGGEYRDIELEIVFYEEGYIYKYLTELDDSDSLEDIARFKNQKMFRKKYYKTNVNKIFEEPWTEVAYLDKEVPEEFSMVFFVLKKAMVREVYYDAGMDTPSSYDITFRLIKYTGLEECYIKNVIRIFDENIEDIKQLEDNNYQLIYQGKKMRLSDKELYRFLSSGTTKGLNLYITAIISLQRGFDLIIDEIENHFHKTLVENLVMLYKDKKVNKKNATLIFSTHYCELLDMFNRSDNIWVTHSKEKIEIDNMYEKYGLRTELLKSKKFYQNAFDTAVNYEALMDLKKELMQ